MTNSMPAEDEKQGKDDEETVDLAVERLTLNLRPTDRQRLQTITQSQRLNKNDAVRRALATEAFVQRTLSEGRKILVEDAEGNLREVEFVS